MRIAGQNHLRERVAFRNNSQKREGIMNEGHPLTQVVLTELLRLKWTLRHENF